MLNWLRLNQLTKFHKMMSSTVNANKKANRLVTSKSPYLLQHAYNPVDWYPWGDEAFKKAKEENKIIFLSVGYSTCHWCHVMERESFEKDDVADILNENFVSVKVDREERPDVDKVYMSFVQLTHGSGGWPMSVWMTPDLQPIIGATYFPPEDHPSGQPGFKTVLNHIASTWKSDQSSVEKQGRAILDMLTRMTASMHAGDEDAPSVTAVEHCFERLAASYEERMGGFGSAPKFPQPVNLDFMLRYYASHQSSEKGKRALDMSLHTLRMMANGGIHDHVSQGMHRYSTDSDWHVPHFEKMLYDQAQLAVSYLEAYQVTCKEEFSEMARDILQYVSRDLSDKNGGFYSAEDADSFPAADSTEKKEGAFCVWTEKDVKILLGDIVPAHPKLTFADIFCHHYDVKENGNVSPHQDPHNELTGQNVLIVRGSRASTASRFKMAENDVRDILQTCRLRLFEARAKRPPPHLDNKMITAWNGLMISAYAKAGAILGDETYIQRALQTVAFIREHLCDEVNGELLRSCYVDENGGIAQIEPAIGGFLTDYAFLVRGLLDLYESSHDVSLLRLAETLQEAQNRVFWDAENGGYYSSTDTDKSIILRMKEDQDGAEPSGNSVSASNLLRLSRLLDSTSYQQMAARVLAAYATSIKRMPQALPSMLCGLLLQMSPAQQIIVIGEKDAADTMALLTAVHRHFLPHKTLVVVSEQQSANGDYLSSKLKIIGSLRKIDGVATAYVCAGQVCSRPVNTPSDLERLLAPPTP